MLARAAEHGDATTRECVCFAYGQLAEHCQPEILAHHRQVLPVVFALMDTGAESVMGISCHVLETFCESMEEQHVVPILDDLANKLLVLLQLSPLSAELERISYHCGELSGETLNEHFVQTSSRCATCLELVLQSYIASGKESNTAGNDEEQQ